MGERFRLRRDFDVSGYSRTNQIILQALKEYGMIVADNGASWYISGDNDPRWNNEELRALKSIAGSNFEAVDLTPVVTGLSAPRGEAGSRLTIGGLNFSGGAGQTRVFFGAAEAAGVTVNSDSSLTVTVPPGALGSAVDVTVWSPYGTSAVRAAGRFTYGVPVATPGQFQLAAAAYSVNESAGALTLTVTRTGGSDGAATVAVAVTPGTAAARLDYTGGPGTVTFAAGQTSATFTVAILDDAFVEGNQTFTVSLHSPTGGATLGAQTAAAVTVLDNDALSAAGTLQFSAATYALAEGGMAVVTIYRTGGRAGAVSVRFTAASGTARAGADFRPYWARLVKFAAGEKLKRLVIPLYDDRLVERNETVRLSLTGPAGGAVLNGRRQARLTITDNDAPRRRPAARKAPPVPVRPAAAEGWRVWAALAEAEWTRRARTAGR
jgi:hypothetical protein